MKRTSRYIGYLMAVVMIVGILAGCSPSKNDTKEAATPSASTENATKDPYVITLALPIFGAIPKDIKAVQAEVNKITQAKINATVEILPISIGAWQQQMNLMMSGGEKLDLAFTFGQNYPIQASAGQFIEIDKLLSAYGEGIEEAVGSEFLKSAQLNGKLHGVPTIHDFAGKSGIFMMEDLIKKYNINVSSIKTMDDLDSVFKTIKDNEPGIAPLGSGLASPGSTYLTYDMLGDRFGVLPNFDNGLKVENYYESADYAQFVHKMHSWFKAGYVSKDAATSSVPEPLLLKADKAFAYFANYHPAMQGQDERKAGKKLVFVELQPKQYATTSKVLVGLWGISQNSKNPERAMMLLNLMYSDSQLANLLLWGIEGQHYVKVSDKVIDYPQGVDSTTVGYANEFWVMGNPFITYTMKTEDPEIWNKTRAYNDSAVKSKALGFTFNTDPVKNEITALNNVVQQYGKILETGTVDPTNQLPEFNSKLKAAGIDKVIAEKQKQLDVWAAAKK